MTILEEQSDDTSIWSFWIRFIPTLYGQYLIALGEFPLEDWSENSDSNWVFPMQILFVIGTFFIMITLLNMLIAIICGTFEHVYASKEVKANNALINLLAENGAKSLK